MTVATLVDLDELTVAVSALASLDVRLRERGGDRAPGVRRDILSLSSAIALQFGVTELFAAANVSAELAAAHEEIARALVSRAIERGQLKPAAGPVGDAS